MDNASDAYANNENERSEVRALRKGMLADMAARNNQAVLSRATSTSKRRAAERQATIIRAARPDITPVDPR